MYDTLIAFDMDLDMDTKMNMDMDLISMKYMMRILTCISDHVWIRETLLMQA